MITGQKFVEGKGTYVDDINLPGTLYMAVVRSPYSRARIRSIKGGLTSKDYGGYLASVGEGGSGGMNVYSEPVLARDYVNYLGQPVAAVFGDDRYKAEDLLNSVDVDYEPLKPVMDIDASLKGEPIHKGTDSNILVDQWIGEEFNLSSPVVLEDTLYNRRVATNPMEPRGVMATYDGSRLTMWVSSQSVHSTKEGICEAMGLSPDSVRVIQADTGGGFGLKGGLHPEYVLAAHAAMKYKRPVKWIETRSEHLSSSNPGRGAKANMKIFADRQGVVSGVSGEVFVDSGSYGGFAEFAPRFIAFQLTGPYSIPNGHIRAVSVLTNKVPQGPYRGAGRPEASFFMERMMDLLADELSMDPADVRVKNLASKPFKSPLGMEIPESKTFFQNALKEFEYGKRFTGASAGLSFFVLVPGVGPGEGARIKIEGGRVKVWLGGDTAGQGHQEFVRTLIEEELGISPDLVELQLGDTDAVKKGVGAWGSRSAISAGNAILAVSKKIRDLVAKDHGKYSAENALSGSYDVDHFEELKGNLNSFGANMAVADVSPLGDIKVKECWSYYDVGRVLSKDSVWGQIRGGAAQGIGQVLSEEIAYSEEGELLTGSIADSGVLPADQVPNFVVKVAEVPSNLPHKVKGLGEAPTIGVPSALVRSIEKVTGKRIRETPVRPETIAEDDL